MLCVVYNKEMFCWNKDMYKKRINSATHDYKKICQRSSAKFIFDLIVMFSNNCTVPLNILDKKPF